MNKGRPGLDSRALIALTAGHFGVTDYTSALPTVPYGDLPLELGTAGVTPQLAADTPNKWINRGIQTSRLDQLKLLSRATIIAQVLWGMDRHVELADYLYGLEQLLASWGIPDMEADEYPGGNMGRLRLINTAGRTPHAMAADAAASKGRAMQTRNPLTYLRGSDMYIEGTNKARDIRVTLGEVNISRPYVNRGSENDPNKWSESSVDPMTGYGTYYKAIPTKDSHSFLVVGEVSIDILSVLSVLCELDLYHNWFPMCSTSIESGRLNPFHRFSNFIIDAPWPVSNREVFLYGYGSDCLSMPNPDDQCIIISSQSMDPVHDPLPMGVLLPETDPRKNSHVFADVHQCCFVMWPLHDGRTKLAYVANLDPKLPSVPMWLINWFTSKLAGVLFAQIEQAAKAGKTPNSPYQRRRKEQKTMYDYFCVRGTQVHGADYVRHLLTDF